MLRAMFVRGIHHARKGKRLTYKRTPGVEMPPVKPVYMAYADITIPVGEEKAAYGGYVLDPEGNLKGTKKGPLPYTPIIQVLEMQGTNRVLDWVEEDFPEIEYLETHTDCDAVFRHFNDLTTKVPESYDEEIKNYREHKSRYKHLVVCWMKDSTRKIKDACKLARSYYSKKPQQ